MATLLIVTHQSRKASLAKKGFLYGGLMCPGVFLTSPGQFGAASTLILASDRQAIGTPRSVDVPFTKAVLDMLRRSAAALVFSNARCFASIGGFKGQVRATVRLCAPLEKHRKASE